MATKLLEGKAGIVTGAGRGIGEAVARELARLGASVVVNDAGVGLDGAVGQERPAELVAAAIRSQGGQALADFGSVSAWQDARDMVTRCLQEFGRLDFVVHNAGIVRDVIFHKMTEDDWDAVLAVHLKGAFCMARAAAEVFRIQRSGSLVLMTSTSGLIGTVGQANYSAAKLGVVALMRSIALDMQRFGVRANAVAPFAWTRMTASIPDDGSEQARKRLEALQRCRPEHIAPMVAYLVADGSKSVTGQVFSVRGTEVSLFSLPRPRATIHRQGGWKLADLADAVDRELQPAFVPLETTADVFVEAPRV